MVVLAIVCMPVMVFFATILMGIARRHERPILFLWVLVPVGIEVFLMYWAYQSLIHPHVMTYTFQ